MKLNIIAVSLNLICCLQNCVSASNKQFCRYDQRTVDIELESKVIQSVSRKQFPQDEYLPADFTPKSKPSKPKSSRLCISYITSTNLDKNDMDKMLDCEIIDLSGNDLDEIGSDLFEKHKQLESLNLSDNFLQCLPDDVFKGLINLMSLSLKNNRLKSIGENLFKHKERLESLDFSNNRLMSIPPAILDNLPKLKIASFCNNDCVDASYPDYSLAEIREHISIGCGEKNMISFIISLMKLSSRMENSTLGEHAKGNITNANVNNRNSSQVMDNGLTNSTDTSGSTTNDRNVDSLIFSLFWLIILIILILFAILSMISYAIYNKYFVYLLSYHGNYRGQ